MPSYIDNLATRRVSRANPAQQTRRVKSRNPSQTPLRIMSNEKSPRNLLRPNKAVCCVAVQNQDKKQ